ncbi:MAG: ABC transporter substrate-binding protein [Myxococcales bacterium]|nr:ABC transporter substrate-binding protein [Myxococcales bacterium]
MTRTLTSFVALFALLVSASAALAGPPTRFLESQVTAVRTLLQKPAAAGTPESDAIDDQLRAIINPVMEFDRLSESALRKHWPTLTPAQRTEFITLFRALVFHSYLKKIRSANEDYTVEYEDEELKSREAATVTAIAKTKKAEIELVFHLIARGPSVWVAEDIVIDEVSLVENYREQFNKIIAKDGFAALTKKMRDKLVDLGGKVPEIPATPAADKPAAPAPTADKPAAPDTK